MQPECKKKIPKKFSYKLEAPEGGWGYIIVSAYCLINIIVSGQLTTFGILYGDFLSTLGDASSYNINIIVSGQLTTFGILYGDFLSTLGDASSGSALVYCVFYTLVSSMGLTANYLLKKKPPRFIAVTGSILYCIGSILSTFSTSLLYFVVIYGILQGAGFGLMYSVSMQVFNQYFVKKKNHIMGIAQTVICAGIILYPYLTRILMDEFGFRGTIFIMAALNCNAIAAMLTYQPVQWHMKKILLSSVELSELLNEESKCMIQTEVNLYPEKDYCSFSRTRTIYQVWKSVYNILELSLLKDTCFVIITIGLSSSVLADLVSVSVLPIVLSNMGFDNQYTAFLMTLTGISDLVGRILFSCVMACVTIKTRYLFLLGSFCFAIVRFVFTMTRSGTIWTTIFCVLNGLLRCFIEVCLPLVLVEYNRERFSALLGVFLAINGIMCLSIAFLTGLITSTENGDTKMLHLLTILNLICAIPWTVQLSYKKFKK